MSGVRLQKIIAQAGVASRRRAEVLIARGRVTVNGETVTRFGRLVDAQADIVAIDGQRLPQRAPLIYVLLHKPRGYVTTREDELGRPTVFDLLNGRMGHLFPVGRLDVNSEGVLLLTNDGPLAHRFLHPRYRIPRTYLVKIQGLLAERDIACLQRGVVLDEGKTLPSRVQVVRRTEKNCVLRLTLYEGRHRQIHRMLQACGGHVVKRLHRLAMGPLTVNDLAPGRYRTLEAFEISRLKRACRPRQVAS